MKPITLAFVMIPALLMLGPIWSHSHALNPSEILKDPTLEKRARQISKNLRCVVCQNQSIDDSDAPLAQHFRVLVRERIEKGDSDQQVVEYLVSRYGDFILLRPPIKGTTIVLWWGPAILLVVGVLGIIFYFLRQNSVTRSKD